MRRGAPLHVWMRWACYGFVALLLCGPCGQCCGPGRGGGRRRSPRKLTPLVFKQHVPNVAENTLGASGLTEGRIARNDARFSDLVLNYNTDIYFKDEEGTGSDRLMSERCKEKLNTLSISVMNQWPGVRLYVFEAWDHGSHHEPHSLHFEGRAVDIATTDKDRSKLGMLARLAVAAGFDWVFYESRSHVHCSVKSEKSSAKRFGGCFPGQATVETPSGPKEMASLKEGDLIQVLEKGGSLKYSPVLMFLHKEKDTSRSFLMLDTEERTLTLTPTHLVFLLRQEDAIASGIDQPAILEKSQAVLAGTVRAGDYLLLTNKDGTIRLSKIINMGASLNEGIFAPLTAEGTIVVNDIIASCYAVIDSDSIAHYAFLPVRIYFKLKDVILSLLKTVGAAQTDDISVKNDNISSYLSSVEPLNSNEIEAVNEVTKSDRFNRYGNVAKRPHSYEPHIHWYAKLLYKIASWTLPNHLVYS